MLKETWECEESRYPANTSHPPKGTNVALRKILTTMIRRIMIDGDTGYSNIRQF